MNPGGQQDIEETSFGSRFVRRVAAVFPQGVRKGVVERNLSMMAIAVLPVEENDEQAKRSKTEQSCYTC